MDDLHYEPPLPSKLSADGFTQGIRLLDKNGKTLAFCRWHARPGDADGVIQLLELNVVLDRTRQGIGGMLFDALVRQGRAYFAKRKSRLRRVWVMLDQKTQINARAFANDHGFHHVASVPNLLTKQEGLIYTLGLD